MYMKAVILKLFNILSSLLLLIDAIIETVK